MYKRFKRWRRTRTYHAPIDWNTAFFLLLPWLVSIALWLLILQIAVLSFKLDAAKIQYEKLQFKLDETEIMLTVCLNGGTPAYTDEEKHRVYIECPTRAKERVYS